MSKLTYVLTENLYCDENHSKTFYGIEVYEAPDKIVATIRDITTDRERLFKFIQTCNLLELSPIHLYDVIEDFLTE